jgi:hypothetical protein
VLVSAAEYHAVLPKISYENNTPFINSSGFNCSSLAQLHSFSNTSTPRLLAAKHHAVYPSLPFENKTQFSNSSGFNCSLEPNSTVFLILQRGHLLLPNAMPYPHPYLSKKTPHSLTPLVVTAVL